VTALRGEPLILLLLGVAELACHRSSLPGTDPRPAATVVAETTVVAVPARLDRSALSPDRARALGRTFARIAVEPPTLTLRVGETLAFDVFRVLATDSAGNVHGHLQYYDYAMAPGAAELRGPMRAVGVESGISELVITVAGPYWGRSDQPRPTARLPIVVE
jgi:hypothetical protein